MLFHLAEEENLPLARSNVADALASKRRQNDLEAGLDQLYKKACASLPDRLKDIPGLQGRQVFAVDGTYQKESAHYKKQTPEQGGKDNPKGHCILSFFDINRGIPISAGTETSSSHEMAVIRSCSDAQQKPLFEAMQALRAVGKDFTATLFWGQQKKKLQTEVVMRLKDNMIITGEEVMPVSGDDVNVGILSNKIVQLNASNELWRLIEYQAPDGSEYTYLINNFDLEPGVIAFLYLRRWDEEKSFDPWKNDFAQKNSWSKNKTAIKNQTT